MNRKKIEEIFVALLILSLSSISIYAAQPSFSFYPSSGIVKNIQEGFTVDVLIDSGGFEIGKARGVIKFDPEIVQLRTAMRNNSLFEEWLTDESSTDNTKGIVILTGYTSEDGITSLYKTDGDPDVFARLKFDIVTTKTNEDVELTFGYNETDELLNSIIMTSGTSGTDVLDSQPSSAVFSLSSEEIIPETAIDMNVVGIVMGVILMLVGGFIRGSKINPFDKRRGTVVLER